MFKNLRSPAAGDYVKLVDEEDSVGIKYRPRRHCSKCGLFLLALVLLFLAVTIITVFIVTTKSNSEGM